MSKHVLVIVSNHAELAGEPNGTYVPELTHAIAALTKHGITYDLASPKGGAMPIYGEDADDETKSMLADKAFAARLKTTMKLDDIDPDKYDGVFYPGGYGLLFDLVGNEKSAKITRALFDRGAPIAAVCHGPAALSSIEGPDGNPLVYCRKVTGFTREEEVAMNTLDKIPLVLEETMMDKGATYSKKSKWKELVIVDGQIITGQNPASAGGVGDALAKALQA
ncbi:MAG: type 1 glutamine amidotransferase domain-containing protein [Myxococcota bacterium]